MPTIEIHPRRSVTIQNGSPTAERLFLDTPHSIGPAVFVPPIGSPHPDNASLIAIQVSKESRYDGDPEQTLTTVTYGVGADSCENAPNPLDRCDRWSMSSSLTSIPVYQWYNEGSYEPLVNTAGDYLPGHTGQFPTARLQLTGNRASFPWAYLLRSGFVNGDSWATANPRAWLCTGMRAAQKSELVGTVVVSYYEVTVEFAYNEFLWQLQVPNVGLYYLESGIRKRCYVEDHNGNYIPATSPVPLDDSGGMKSGSPDILTRPIYPEAAFTSVFGAVNL